MPVPPGPLALLRCRPQDVFSTLEGDEPMASQPDSYCCRFCPRPGSRHVLVSADEDGAIKLWDSRPTAPQRVIHAEAAHTNAIYELDWSHDGRHLLSAAGDRTVKLWDVGEAQLTQLAVFSRHSRTVKTVTFLQEDPCVFASGGRDGAVIVWDVRVTKQVSHEIRPKRLDPDSRLRGASAARPAESTDTISSLAFRDGTYLLSAASGASAVSVWDLRKLYSIAQRQPPPVYCLDGAEPGRGVVSVTTDREQGQLYVSRINDVIQRYSMTSWTADPAGTFSGAQCGSFFVRCSVSPNGGWLAAGGSDHSARLWSTRTAGPPVGRLGGHTDEVTCVAWSSDSNTLATVSDDQHLRLWRTDPCPGDTDTREDTSVLTMERLEPPACSMCGSCGPSPGATPPLPLYPLCRETGIRWRPAPLRVLYGSPGAAASVRQGGRGTQTSAAAARSSVLSSWVSAQKETPEPTAARTSPRKRQVEGDGTEDRPSSRGHLSLALSPSKMCFSPGSASRSGQSTPVKSPFKRFAVTLSPSKASTSAAGAVSPTGGSPGCSSWSPTRRSLRLSPSKSGRAGTPTDSLGASSTAGSPRRSVLGDVNDERVVTPTPPALRWSPTRAAVTPSSDPAGGLSRSPHTPARRSPRKTPAKVLFSASPAARGAACLTPETGRRRPADQYRSPTADLPNFVLDGRSPHRPLPSRPRRQPQPNWLTCLSQRKRAQQSPAAAPPAAKRSRRPARGRKQTPG
ncbi:denticleless protein homolog B-like isoform X2 [Amphibalanus amphitrite]|nr:denticleless protein homolog B-like isoform X2 [Amphibalanus amphitrite]